jgi:quercetin dioxygenase-like cupin family protein
MKWLLPVLLLPACAMALENDYVKVTRDAAPCAAMALADCGDRVIVALGNIEMGAGESRRAMRRGDTAIFPSGERYEAAAGGSYFEVNIKPGHPPALAPSETIAPEKNSLRHDGRDFIVFEEKLAPGDTRARHSHSQRVVIQLNKARLKQWPDGEPEKIVETVPDKPLFSPPVVHVVENIGEAPLFGVIIEFKPGVR